MSIWDVIPELPLLRRELTELSSRRRTYIVRFVGAIVVLTIVLFFYGMLVAQLNAYGFGGASSNPNRMFGAGGPIFRGIVPILFVSVQMLMPALICGSITIEKERNTIGTLFVTRLSPMTIVLEKLGSRLVPMFTFLLLTFPVLAFVYSLGGVETTLLLGTMWLLFCECLLYASIGLLCSSWFATTVTAFIWSYVLTGLLAVASSLLAHDLPFALPTPFYVWLAAFQGFGRGFGNNPLLPPSSGGFWASVGHLILLGGATIPSLMVTAVFVLLARVFLVRRAFISPASLLLKVFKSIDTFFTRLNDRTTGGMVIMKDYNSLPLFDPVAWRERSKKSLGKARYLFRILVVMEGPTLFICVGAATVTSSADFAALRSLLMLVWGIAAMIIAMKGSTVISAERVRETLDALLSTPLTAKDILIQKVAGMNRLMIVLAIPILSVYLTLLLLHVDLRSIFSGRSFDSIFTVIWYAVSCVLTTFLTMKILAWLAVLLGLRSQSQSRSAMTAICLLAFWILLTSFCCRPGGLVYGTVLNMADRNAPLRSSEYFGHELTPREMQANIMASAVCCLFRLDGGVQANEAVLLAGGNSQVERSELYYAPSHSVASALTVSTIVFIWQICLVLLIRAITLRLAPGLLQRVDQHPGYPSLESQLSPSYAAIGSEVIA